MEDLTGAAKDTLARTSAAMTDYFKGKALLDAEVFKLKEVEISHECIRRHLGDEGTASIAAKIDEQRELVTRLSGESSIQLRTLRQEKRACRDLLETLRDVYHAMSGIGEVCIEPDSFTVEMCKLLYPTPSDNQQMRHDPPIAGVFKADRSHSAEAPCSSPLTDTRDVDGMCSHPFDDSSRNAAAPV